MFVRELEKGDIFLLPGGVRIEVEVTVRGEVGGPEPKPIIYVFDTSGKQWTLHPWNLVQLIYRPGSSASQSNLFLDLIGACRNIVVFYEVRSIQDNAEYVRDRDELLTALRKVLDAHELGKPSEAAPSAERDADDIPCTEEQREHLRQEGFW